MGYLYLKEDFQGYWSWSMQDLRRRKFKLTEMIEGRNAVLEAFRSGKCVDKLFILDGCQDGPVRTIAREARKHDTIVKFVPKERLDSMSETGAHQGVIAQVAAYDYSTVEDILKKQKIRESLRLSFFLIILKILIIWELSSVPQISQVLMV